MPGKRAKGQKQVLTMFDEKFLREIARAMARAGYSDRSSFIRDAVWEKLKAEGILVSYQFAMAPSRSGKITQIHNHGSGDIHYSETARAAERPGDKLPKTPAKKIIYEAKRKKKGSP